MEFTKLIAPAHTYVLRCACVGCSLKCAAGSHLLGMAHTPALIGEYEWLTFAVSGSNTRCDGSHSSFE
jgi:hypothetical protein